MKEEVKISAAWKNIFLLSERLRTLWQPPEIRRYHHKLTLNQLKVLFFAFAYAPGGIKQKELARELGVTPGAISQTVDGLVRAGFLERRPHPGDRRAIAILPSTKADAFTACRDKVLGGITLGIFSGIDSSDAAIFMKVLEHITANSALALKNKKKESHQ